MMKLELFYWVSDRCLTFLSTVFSYYKTNLLILRIYCSRLSLYLWSESSNFFSNCLLILSLSSLRFYSKSVNVSTFFTDYWIFSLLSSSYTILLFSLDSVNLIFPYRAVSIYSNLLLSSFNLIFSSFISSLKSSIARLIFLLKFSWLSRCAIIASYLSLFFSRARVAWKYSFFIY